MDFMIIQLIIFAVFVKFAIYQRFERKIDSVFYFSLLIDVVIGILSIVPL